MSVSRPAAAGRGTDKARAEARLGWYLAGPAFVILVAVTGYPILQALYESLFSYRLTAPADREFIGLKNYGSSSPTACGGERWATPRSSPSSPSPSNSSSGSRWRW